MERRMRKTHTWTIAVIISLFMWWQIFRLANALMEIMR